MRFRLRSVSGPSKKTMGYVTRADGCALEEVEVPASHRTVNSEQVRLIRRERGLFLSRAAQILGVSISDVSALEHGQLEPENAEDWPRILEALRTCG